MTSIWGVHPEYLNPPLTPPPPTRGLSLQSSVWEVITDVYPTGMSYLYNGTLRLQIFKVKEKRYTYTL